MGRHSQRLAVDAARRPGGRRRHRRGDSAPLRPPRRAVGGPNDGRCAVGRFLEPAHLEPDNGAAVRCSGPGWLDALSGRTAARPVSRRLVCRGVGHDTGAPRLGRPVGDHRPGATHLPAARPVAPRAGRSGCLCRALPALSGLSNRHWLGRLSGRGASGRAGVAVQRRGCAAQPGPNPRPRAFALRAGRRRLRPSGVRPTAARRSRSSSVP